MTGCFKYNRTDHCHQRLPRAMKSRLLSRGYIVLQHDSSHTTIQERAQGGGAHLIKEGCRVADNGIFLKCRATLYYVL